MNAWKLLNDFSIESRWNVEEFQPLIFFLPVCDSMYLVTLLSA